MGASLPRIRFPQIRRRSAWRPHALVLVLITLPVLAEMGVHNGSWRPASAATRAGVERYQHTALDRTAQFTQLSPDGRIGVVTLMQGTGAAAAPHTMLMEYPSGRVIDDLQRFAVWRNGTQVDARDVAIADVAFTNDSNVFYASVTAGGETFRVRGDVRRRELTAVQQ